MTTEAAIRFARRRRLVTLLGLAQRVRSWTRRDLAAALGRDPSNLLSATGLPKIDVACRLADVLQWPRGHLLDAVVNVPVRPRRRGDPSAVRRVDLDDDPIAHHLRNVRLVEAIGLVRLRLREGAAGGFDGAARAAPGSQARCAPSDGELLVFLAAIQLAAGEAVEAIAAAKLAGLGIDGERADAPGPSLRAATAVIEALSLRLQHERSQVGAPDRLDLDGILEAMERAADQVTRADPNQLRRFGLPGAATGALIGAARESVEACEGRRDRGASLAEASAALVMGRGDAPPDLDRLRVSVQRCLWLVSASDAPRSVDEHPLGDPRRSFRPQDRVARQSDHRGLAQQLLRQASAAALDRCRDLLPTCDDWSLRREWFVLEARRRRALLQWKASDGARHRQGPAGQAAHAMQEGWQLRPGEIEAIAGLIARFPSFRSLGWSILDAARLGIVRNVERS